jgi:pilus assembly protein CpaC
LLQTTLGGNAARVPFLGDLPVVGTLFTNKNNSASEQELVVLVTPELAHPLEACSRPPLPGADVFEPTDVEFYLGNRLESRWARDFRSPVRTDHHRIWQFEKHGYDRYIIGPSGYSDGGTAAAAAWQPPLVQPLPPATYSLRDGS